MALRKVADDEWTANGIKSTFIIDMPDNPASQVSTALTGICGLGWRFSCGIGVASTSTSPILTNPDSSVIPWRRVTVFFNPDLIRSANYGPLRCLTEVEHLLPLENAHLCREVNLPDHYNETWELGGYMRRGDALGTARIAISVALAPTLGITLPRPLDARVEAALMDTIRGEEVVDVKFYAYTRRDLASESHVVRPRAMYAKMALLKGHSDDLDNYLKGFSNGAGFAESRVVDLDRDSFEEEEFAGYDYLSDSDLDTDDEEDGTQSAHSASFNKKSTVDSATIPLPPSRSSTPPVTVSRRMGHVVPVKGYAFKTWNALLYYLYTNKVAFRSSESSTPRVLRVPECSAKSMYRLADAFGLGELKGLALAALRSQLSADNIVREAFSTFTSMYREIQDIEVQVLVDHLPNLISGEIDKTLKSVCYGERPQCFDVLCKVVHIATARPPTCTLPRIDTRLAFVLLLQTSMTAGTSAGKVLKRANPGTIQDKFLVGYQGWFTCANDGPPIGEGHHGWLHWLNQPLPPPHNGRPNTDLWPDTSAYDPSELYPVEGLTHRDGSPAKVFSSRDPRTVRRHFHWMAEHGVDGAFLQRFVGQVDQEDPGNRDERYGGTRRLRDEVGRRVREAAEEEGRVWAIMYDVSGVPAADILRIVTQDIAHLVHEERIFDSPAYLRERGRPVVAVWGFGLSDSPVSPHLAREVFAALRAAAGELYIFAGVPSHWRTPGAGDAHADLAWAALWLGGDGAVDAVSPWSVGRFSTSADVEAWAAERWAGDAELVARHNEGIELRGEGGRKVDYVPVVLPGGSGFNLSEGKWAFNGIKRNGGKFLWSQIFHAKRLKGVRSMYGAMWDEYDEGTAFLPVIEKKRLLPESEAWPFLALDEDGYDLPSDWYMRIAGFAAEGLRSERRVHDSFPSKELQDYWSTRPRYENPAASSAAGSSSSAGAASGGASAVAGGSGSGKQETAAEREAKAQFDAWAEEQRRKEAETEDLPPPAYTLEDEGPAVQEEPAVTVAPVQVQQSVAPAPQSPVQQQFSAPQRQFSAPQSPAQQQFSGPQRQFSAPQSPAQQQFPHLQNVAPQSPARQQFHDPAAQQQHYNGAPDLNYAARPTAGAGVGVAALTGEFARQRIGASPPPQHPASASASARRESGPGYAGGAGVGLERPPLHPAHPQAGRVGSQDSVAGGNGRGSGSFGAGGRAETPEVQGAGQGQWAPHQYGVKPYQQQQGPGYQQAQHTGGSAGSGSGAYSVQQQQQHSGGSAGAAYPPQGAYQRPQHTGGSAGSGSYQQPQHTGGSASSYPAQQQQYPAQQQQQHTGGSAGAPYAAQAGPHQQYAQSYEPQRQQQQHTGGSGSSAGASSYPAQGGSQYQPEPHRQQQQHTGGSGSYPAQGARPTSTYPGQAAGYAAAAGPSLPARPASSYAAESPGYASGSGLRPSTSLSARPPPSMYPASPLQGPSARPDSAPRPTTPSYASYPAGPSAYAASPPPHGGPPLGPHASLAPRPESVRPTTPGYGPPMGPPPPSHGGPPLGLHASLAPRPESVRPTTPGYGPPMGPPPPSSYSNQFPSPNPNGPPASYPGSSYNPSPTLPSPDIPFPPGPQQQYGGAPYQPSGSYGAQSFPTPQGPYSPSSPPLGAPSYPPPGPSFPQGGSDNSYFYQQPPQPHFPSTGYSPPQPDMYNNYAQQQPQGPWVPGGGPPSHQPGYGQPVSYGFPTAQAAPPSGPLGFATTSVDKIVGRRTREQLEGTVESLAQSSTKLMNKFRM
ncbi:hypothetical protein DFH09DRAFT_1374678 [Mycena vulgaris]|nr:hypothetical protein DFH09DRAFT_1374678 [Mycena vulgaris]